MSNWYSYGCFWASGSSFGWRFPNAVIVIWAILFLVGTFFIPESPRWLVEKGRDDEALQILCRLHRDAKDSQHTFAQQELVLIQQQIAKDEKQEREGGRWQILTEKSYRTRLILATITVIGSQNVGVLVSLDVQDSHIDLINTARSSTTTMPSCTNHSG